MFPYKPSILGGTETSKSRTSHASPDRPTQLEVPGLFRQRARRTSGEGVDSDGRSMMVHVYTMVIVVIDIVCMVVMVIVIVEIDILWY